MEVSPHIQDYEVICPFTHEIKLSPFIINLFEAVRNDIGCPIFITSGYRSPQYQKHLTEINPYAVKLSPHPEGAALDMQIPFRFEPLELAHRFQEHSKRLGYGTCRYGLEKYKFRFIHVDIIYMLYHPWTNTENPKPDIWKEGVTW